MKFVKDFFSKAGPPALAWALNIAVPAIPSGVWLALINGLIAGDLTLAHIEAFLAAHHIQTYYAPTDFPNAPPQSTTISNINRG
jgi:hypothetical protein